MDITTTVVLAVAAVVLIVLTAEIFIPSFLPRAIVLLANVDSWWSPFRILPPPGEMYILVSGDPEGPYDSLLESVHGWDYDEATQTFTENPDDRNERTGYLGKLGVARVGFNKYLLWRKVRYDKWEKKPDPSTEYGLVSKTRGDKKKPGDTPSIFFRYNMATEIKAAETVGNFPVDGLIVFTAQLTNPVKAFFFAGGWEVQTVAAVQGAFREYVGKKSIEELRKEQKEPQQDGDSLIQRMKGLGRRDDPDGLYAKFGVEIVDARFVNFDLVKGDQAMTEAVRAVEVAKRQAEAKLETAKGSRNAKIAEAQGEAEAKRLINEADRDRLIRVILPAAADSTTSEVFRSDRESAAYEANKTITTWVNGASPQVNVGK